MAPKALTDCPENLREAIDWLVQVQHCDGVSTVSDALATLFNNAAQDAEKSLSSLPDPDRPSARDVVSKLRALQSTLPKDSENPNKNIIHNLCTSAASLLGHRSPGTYDGSGIVYGNASRLCDAILAFLYAVFSDVHGNQPYVAGRSVLHDVVVQLKSQLWRGHKGLCQAIPKVATGLQRYNAAVTASNERVKEPIETVLEYVKPDGELCKGIQALQITETSTSAEDERSAESAVSLVERCKEVARAFSKSLTAATNAINDLHPKLKRKLENARRSFFNHVDWLSRWSKKGQKKRLDKMIQKIKSRLKRLANAVKDKIQQEVHTVVELLKERVKDIRMKLEGITASLEEYVKELGRWMDEAKKYINAVKNYVNQIMQELDGEHKKAIDQAAGEIDSELGKRVEELNEWIKDAEDAVKAAKKKAEDVYERLDRNSSTTISKGVNQISEANKKVSEVNRQLGIVHKDLVDWKHAAEDVLRTAVERAEQVHKQLDPANDQSTLGSEIGKIDTANKDIINANTALGQQVKLLNKWIETAEDIRQKAEQKAKEAYDRLQVHEKLSENVKRIVEAKEKIEGVNKSVNSHLGSLKQWNEKAKEVITGAVEKAQEVYDDLEDGKTISKKVEEISSDNASIIEANKKLAAEVDHLGKWKDVAEKVIKMAENKCDEILKRVDKNHKDNESGKQGPKIFLEASKLKEQGTKLLAAAKDAKQKVDSKVKEALHAVKGMDRGLKQDLKKVKDRINDGIKKVIEELQVGELGKKVQEDLEVLRGKIRRLKDKVDERNGDSIVKDQLIAVGEAKTQLTEKTKEIKKQTEEMNKKFEESIKDPLDKSLQAVEGEIEKLYGQINPGGRATAADKKQLHKIFEHIRNEVEKIKGKEGTSASDKNANGLDGIVSKTKGLVLGFGDTTNNNHGFDKRVDGWLESILGIGNHDGRGMKAVTSWITAYSQTGTGNDNDLRSHVRKQIKNALKNQMHAAQQKITATDVKESIVENLRKIKEACDTFVEELDKQLTNNQIEEFVNKIITEIPGSSGSGRQGENDNLKTGVSAALIALCRCVWQVASEINFLGVGMFGGIIDETKKTVDNLHGNLKAATSTGGAATGTAQAVDEAIGDAKNMVGELDTKFNELKQPVDTAIQGFDAAVTLYDKSAQEQIKKAANKAIDKAAEEISKEGESEIDLGSKMENFNETYQDITSNLQPRLTGLLNEHIGRDDMTSIPQGSKQKQTTVILANGMFKNYEKWIGVGPLTKYTYGNLDKMIHSINSDGIKALNDSGEISQMFDSGDSTFNGPFNKIEGELKEIAELVSDTKIVFTGESVKNSSGLRTFLRQLQEGLDNNQLGDSEKGLDAIRQGIERLQTKNFGPSSEKIKAAVSLIEKEVKELKKKLKSDSDSDKSPVINSLKYLKDAGLGVGKWNGKGGNQVDGLKKIEGELHEQNRKLPEETKIIGEAMRGIMNIVQSELRKIKFKLHDDLAYDDVVDKLRRLENMIGLNVNTDEGLQGIKNKIGELQSRAFQNNPELIGQAKQDIDKELKKLQGELQNEVSSKLTDLVNKGFGGDDKWNGHNAKGFDHIKGNLQSQQSDLSNQAGQIGSGMREITDELQSLRTELQGTGDDNPRDRGVIKNLGFLTTQLGENENKGLKKIKSDLDSVKISQVPLITKHLHTMSLNITNAAGPLGLNLNQLENPHIDVKLKGIQDGLEKLRLTDLAEAIRLCDAFLINADEIEKNTIDALLKHVDDEVDDAIKDLTKEARENYVDSVREALELFARKVNEDLEQLPGDINHDLKIGFKGFVNTAEGDKSVNINKLKCVESRELKLLSAAFAGFFDEVNEYVRKEITRLHDEQNKERNPSLPPTAEPYTPKLNDVYEALTALLAYFRDSDDGADRLTELVERLIKALSNLVPSDFKHPSTPLLDTVSIGLTKFASEFHNTYISAYSGQRCREEHAHKYAKVLLSIIPMTYQGLTKLATKCESEWKHLHICKLTADDRDNPLGNYLTRCGYRVSTNNAVQEGELRCDMLGGGIYELLISPIPEVAIEMHLGGKPLENGINLVTVVAFLYNTLCRYFQVCHIPVPPNPRYPCTVRDMLSWLSGLQYTRVADKLPGHCKALLNRQCHDGDTPNKDDTVMAKCIESLPFTIATTCSHSTSLLTAIQGNGHGFDLAAYPYSVDFSNNRAKLHYPSDPAELLDMLREITCRLCRVLYFLYSQCCRSTARVKGWRECAYGRQVQSHHWQCGQFHRDSTNSATTTATTATSNTTSSTSNPGCPPTSPLQSFLSDSCHGLLPHTLTATNMVIECANCTANLPGQQCLTPLGFWDLGFAASISGTGWALAKRLGDMCRDADSCLFVLCRSLFLLCPAAPSSLADVFALYAQVLRQWDPHERVKHRGGTYTDASGFISHLNTDGIDSLFPMWTQLHGSYENNKLISAISSLAAHDHKSHDALSSLLNDSTCRPLSGCAPYLQPLGLHAYHTYPQKHAGLYITWIMHLAWQFWELLCELLHALDNIDCTASGCATCPCQPGTHGEDTCHCPSLVQCAGPLPTLYRYGFTYRNANLIVAANRTMRCGDLNTQLKEALHSDHFTELFRQIDQLIWHIRMPFLYFLIALWSLIALYTLHTFLYRLDVFHIRSHLLTTKASHLIDVKALLIPSRKMLSLYDASYFDDDPSELLNAT